MTTDLPVSDIFQDPRLSDALATIRQVVTDHQQQLTGPGPADSERIADYETLLAQMSDLRGGALYYPYLGTGLGNGALVQLADGSVKYDMITGIGVHVFGHSNAGLIEAIVRGAVSDSVMQGNLQQNLDSMRLCRLLTHLACDSGAELKHCFLSTSGATANENALKMMLQARSPASRILAFDNCFSGRTLALSQITDRPNNRQGMPTTLAVDYIPFYDANDPEGSIARSVVELQKLLERYPGQHAGMIAELIQGEGGYYPAPREFFVQVFDLLRKHGIFIFLDEVQTFGRTDRFFAFQSLGLDAYADVVSIGKMSQVCATLFIEELKPGPGLISQTFTGATSSIHAALYVLEQFQEQGLLGEHGRTAQIHERFRGHFERLHAEHPELISGPWGQGGMIAFTAFDGSGEKTKAFLHELFSQGVIAFPAGANPTRVRMLPPLLVVTDDEIDDVCRIIGETLQAEARK